LDSQEEFLIKENKRHVKVKNAYAKEMEKNENLTKELNICHDTISNLRTENVNLIAKVEKSNVCHNSIVNLKNDNASLIAKIDKLNACKPSTSTIEQIAICTSCETLMLMLFMIT
jgi:predicted KAP-like P-loop ATPase